MVISGSWFRKQIVKDKVAGGGRVFGRFWEVWGELRGSEVAGGLREGIKLPGLF